ncbi:MAG: lipid II flippase MurJ [Oscillospiraceae bacterium]|nr:lipid II flippase MurJ [Oscillospiraceae bacterium]
MVNMRFNLGKVNIFKTIFSVSTVLLVAKLLGFIRQIIIANAFGATIETDVISLSQGIITDFDFIIMQTMLTAFVPVYLSVKKNEINEKHFVSNYIKLVFTGILILSILVFFAAPLISRFIAPSYEEKYSLKVTNSIRLYAFSLVIFALIAVFNALLKANKRFVSGELISINQSVVFIVLVVLFGKKVGVNILILAFFVSAVINVIVIGWQSKKYWIIERGRLTIDENIKQIIHMIVPLLVGHAMLYVNQLVDKILASGLAAGTVTAMSYSSVLMNFVTSFIGTICGIAFTYIADSIANHSEENSSAIVGYFAQFLVTALIPITVFTVINAKDIVALVFGHGAFDATAVETSSYALMGYGIMFVPYIIRELFSRLHYGYKDTRRPMINSSISIGTNIVLSILLSKIWGVFGITFASSVSVIVCAILNVLSSRKHSKYTVIQNSGKVILLWSAGTAVCIAVNVILRNVFPIDALFLRMVVLCLASFAAYGVSVLPIILAVIRRRDIITAAASRQMEE